MYCNINQINHKRKSYRDNIDKYVQLFYKWWLCHLPIATKCVVIATLKYSWQLALFTIATKWKIVSNNPYQLQTIHVLLQCRAWNKVDQNLIVTYLDCWPQGLSSVVLYAKVVRILHRLRKLFWIFRAQFTPTSPLGPFSPYNHSFNSLCFPGCFFSDHSIIRCSLTLWSIACRFFTNIVRSSSHIDILSTLNASYNTLNTSKSMWSK